MDKHHIISISNIHLYEAGVYPHKLSGKIYPHFISINHYFQTLKIDLLTFWKNEPSTHQHQEFFERLGIFPDSFMEKFAPQPNL